MRRNSPIKLTANEKTDQIRRVALYRALQSGIVGSRLTYGNTTTFGGLRDVYTALGYPGLDGIKFSDYYHRYRRQDIAGKVIEKPVEASWRRLPIVRGTDDKSDAYKEAWEELEKRLGIYNILIRADKVSGIGQYGVLLMGFNDQAENLGQPVESASELLYLQPFTEANAPIKQYVTDPKDPRFGLPLTYGLRIANTPGTASTLETTVHYSRVVHIADNLLESNVLGIPRLERIFNRLLNMELIVGGSAEMFWQGAFPGMAFTAAEDTTIQPQDAAALEEEIQKYVHNLERYMKLQGLDVKSLAPAVADPTQHGELQLKMISIATGIPKRILEGSERGELSSSQDTEAWDDQCDGRRKTFVEPCILRPVIDKLNAFGILKVPAGGYDIEWPDLSAPSDKDKAETGRIRSEGLSKYLSSPDAQLSMPLEQYLLEIMELAEDKVERIMTALKTYIPPMAADDGQGDDDLEDQTTEE